VSLTCADHMPQQSVAQPIPMSHTLPTGMRVRLASTANFSLAHRHARFSTLEPGRVVVIIVHGGHAAPRSPQTRRPWPQTACSICSLGRSLKVIRIIAHAWLLVRVGQLSKHQYLLLELFEAIVVLLPQPPLQIFHLLHEAPHHIVRLFFCSFLLTALIRCK